MHYLVLIRELYAVESSMTQELTAAQIVDERRQRSRPVLEQIHQSLAADASDHLPKSAMAEAIGYAKNPWNEFIAYVDYGDARIDNNLTEQTIRPPKRGAKNWLFIVHLDARPRTAMIYSILAWCRQHKVEPLAYLNDVLRRLPSMTNHEVPAARSEA